MTDTTDDDPTATLVFSQREARFVEVVLRQANESDVDIHRSAELAEELTGQPTQFVGGTEEFYADPPSIGELREALTGQEMTLSRTGIEAFQTVITVWGMKYSREVMEGVGDDESGGGTLDVLTLITGIHRKIRDAYEEVGGYDEDAEGYA